eukprot:GFUD01124451.1.p1 GENE.GFUD01124451.1~~GFUD01124451.1.p1  ORF type:complete len:102 (-),score=1.00 GFUD01124451.1:50-355(-)
MKLITNSLKLRGELVFFLSFSNCFLSNTGAVHVSGLSILGIKFVLRRGFLSFSKKGWNNKQRFLCFWKLWNCLQGELSFLFLQNWNFRFFLFRMKRFHFTH